MQKTMEPVRLSLDLACSVDHAFEVYTSQMASWWPFDSHSVSGVKTADAVFEARVGGRIYEVDTDGKEHDWGKVAECKPPHHLLYSWHPGRDAKEGTTEVEVKFVETKTGCHMELTHRGFELYGERAEVIRDNYVGGWADVAGRCFKKAAEG